MRVRGVQGGEGRRGERRPRLAGQGARPPLVRATPAPKCAPLAFVETHAPTGGLAIFCDGVARPVRPERARAGRGPLRGLRASVGAPAVTRTRGCCHHRSDQRMPRAAVTASTCRAMKAGRPGGTGGGADVRPIRCRAPRRPSSSRAIRRSCVRRWPRPRAVSRWRAGSSRRAGARCRPA